MKQAIIKEDLLYYRAIVCAGDSSSDGKTKGLQNSYLLLWERICCIGDSTAIVLLLEYTKLLLPSMNFLSNFKQLYHMHK